MMSNWGKSRFFLVLNTDGSFKFDLKDDHTICHLLNFQFTKCLLFNIIWDYNLWLLEIRALLDIKPRREPHKIHLPQHCRSDFHTTANPVEKKIILNKFFDQKDIQLEERESQLFWGLNEGESLDNSLLFPVVPGEAWVWGGSEIPDF